jgi:hypothetical protein
VRDYFPARDRFAEKEEA